MKFMKCIFLFFLATNTSLADSPPNTKTRQVKTSELIHQYFEILPMQLSQIQKKFSIDEQQIQKNISYENTTGLIGFEISGKLPCFLYLLDKNITLMYVNETYANAFSVKSLEKSFGANAIGLKSRAGKTYTHHVNSQKGIAWSDNGSRIAWIELFNPTSIENYKKKWYSNPGIFYK